VSYGGGVAETSVDYDYDIGVRPVIEISK